ncbi:hypothetical protein KAR91_53035 [Candidatus Pacearchaeota archaeon]|nr:hypothetical protein [Candidatus Pacearchaeota archaeon]
MTISHINQDIKSNRRIADKLSKAFRQAYNRHDKNAIADKLTAIRERIQELTEIRRYI